LRVQGFVQRTVSVSHVACFLQTHKSVPRQTLQACGGHLQPLYGRVQMVLPKRALRARNAIPSMSTAIQSSYFAPVPASDTEGSPQLLQILRKHELPHWYTSYKHIEEGYRHPAETISSVLFSIHAETVNIYTHLLPAPFTLWLLTSLVDRQEALVRMSSLLARIAVYGSGISTFFILLASGAAHLVHYQSPSWTKIAWTADFCTMTVGMFFKFLSDCYAAFGFIIDPSYFFLLIGFGAGICLGLLKALIEGKAWAINAIGAWCLGPGMLSLAYFAYGSYWPAASLLGPAVDQEALLYVFHWSVAASVICAIGVVFYITFYPESKYPGKFDYVGNSHNIWHIFVVIATWCSVVSASGIPALEASFGIVSE
jgi:adiponectin receptor